MKHLKNFCGRHLLSIILVSSLVLQTVLPIRGNQPYDEIRNNNDHAESKQQTSRRRVELSEEEHEIGYIMGLNLHAPPLYSKQSSYQKIEIYESDHFGKVFVLDECLQLTERDAANYNEMLAHVPIMEYYGRRNRTKSIVGNDENHQNEELNVLVLGGGDGYVVSEVLKHEIVKNVDHCELDEDVIQVSEKYFSWAKDLWDENNGDDTRISDSIENGDNDQDKIKKGALHLYVEDGAKFVEKKSSQQSNDVYHIIIQDSSDPFVMESDGELVKLPSHVLYTEAHFENIYKILKKSNGVLIFQAETYNIPSNLKEIRKWKDLLISIGFKNVRYGSISTPTYSTGQIGFFIAHALDDYDNTCSNSQNNEEGGEIDDGSSIPLCSNELENGDFLDYDMMNAYFESNGLSTQYYHPPLHRSSFDLPLWVHQYINDAKIE